MIEEKLSDRIRRLLDANRKRQINPTQFENEITDLKKYLQQRFERNQHEKK